MHLKRAFLIALIICLALAALIGILALLSGESDEMVWRTIGSLITIGAASGIALAALDTLEKGRWRLPMIGSFTLTAITAAYAIFLIWFGEALFGYQAPAPFSAYAEAASKLLGLLITWAIAVPAAGQLTTLVVKPSWAIVRLGTLACIFLLAGMITGAILGEIEEEFYYRGLGVVAILTILGGVTLRIVQRVQKIDLVTNAVSTAMALKLTCPRCFLEQTVNSGASRCAHCKLRFTIEIEEPRCPQCNYLLHHLTRPVCPECGLALSPDDVPEAPPPSPV
jgi:hypothetical protein